ncbi:class I SAM-dependent methyltransferase [Nitrospina watsonii]|uniref:Menaquinone biosynthesis methyltransferase related protein n=1 Tax=Nitrospina watsonii TaxID=1323948 RepID=A0ABN8VTJ2_9BACT|nr:methyltransferase domain-containing protein [Nitrospina watsonii]CAI2717018.1 Menaquinone biosynthesis methyltransferase related protein [Nitrospina watsonii]
MNIQDNAKKYFDENGENWLIDGYEQSGHNYPTALHRVRVTKNILSQLEDVSHLLDVGCGGGQLAFSIAELGVTVTGVDQNEKMIQTAQAALSGMPGPVRDSISFELKSVDQLALENSNHDALTAMGLIGYLKDDETLFKAASKNLRKNGYLIVSFRNRLFNLFSISERTLMEAESGNFARLVEEISQWDEEVDEKTTLDFVTALHAITGQILENKHLLSEPKRLPSETRGKSYASKMEPRQTTPKESIETAQKCGFKQISFSGIHPHFSVPRLNKALPPQVYNRISDSLVPFENSSLSLLWSSVFIGVFQKID